MGAHKGFFLYEFFGRILPGDRHLFTPILEFLKWRRVTKSLGLLSWIAIWLALCGFLSLSFIHNMAVLKGFTEDIATVPVMTTNTADNLITMDKFRRELVEIHKANTHWWNPRFGLTASVHAESDLRQKFNRLFEKSFMEPMDRLLANELHKVTPSTPEGQVIVYAEHLVGRIKLLQSYLKGTLSKRETDLCNVLPDILPLLDDKLLPEIAGKFEMIYLYYLQEGITGHTAQAKIKELQTALVELIFRKSQNLNWLVKWANTDVRIRDIRLQDFWGEHRDGNGSTLFVDGAYTVAGHKRITEFVTYLEDALPADVDISDEKKKFNLWYKQEYCRAWKAFGQSFSDGRFNVNGVDEWREMGSKMMTPHNPYFSLVERMHKELKPVAIGGNIPGWIRQVMEARTIIDVAAKEERAARNQSLLAKAAHKGETLVQGVVKEAQALTDMELEEKRSQAAEAFNNYMKDMEELLPVSTAQSQAYKAASEFYPYSLKPSDSKSPFFAAFGELQKLAGYLPKTDGDSIAMQLLEGPVRFLLLFVSMETACSLQHDWEDIVLGEIQGVSSDKMPELLFGDKGVVWKFVNGPASPFLGRNKYGYFAKKAQGARIPFKRDFFTFITRGGEVSTSIQPEYKVQIKALPIDVNDDARKEPYEVSLDLGCASGKMRLENYNHPAQGIFTYVPVDCGDVTLQIYFEGLVLSKVYPGHGGFPQFLADFKNGSRRFTPDDFPESKGILKKMNVSEIKVSYEFVDSKPVIQLLEKVPRHIPDTVTACWSE